MLIYSYFSIQGSPPLVAATEDPDPFCHIVQALQYHQQYLDCFLDTHRFLMYGNGPLPYHYRHYIGIMVSLDFSFLLHFEYRADCIQIHALDLYAFLCVLYSFCDNIIYI